MLIVLVVLAIGAAATYRATTPEERQRFLEGYVQPAAVAIDELILATEPCRARLIARTPWLVATPVIAGLNVVLFGCLAFGSGSASEQAALVGWGASYGPSTTNGEWWRLVTAVFLQPGPFHLMFTLIGFLQVAELLERMVGPYIVSSVYVVSGVLGTVLTLSQQPLGVHAGASAAVFGLYGLLLGAVAWTFIRLRGERISLPVLKTLAPAAVVFLVYNLLSFEISGAASQRGFLVGLLAGLALTMDAGERQPSLRPLAIALPAAIALVLHLALPLRGIVDVRPDLAAIVAKEERTADMYRSAVGRFTRVSQPVDTTVLIDLIDRTIVPQFGTARSMVAGLSTTLTDQQTLLEGASEYLRLRESSWRLRAEALRRRNMTTLREAERAEQASLRALEKLRLMRTVM